MKNRLREFRLAADLTQEELAARADCTKATVSRIETGSRRGSVNVRVRLAAALRRPTAEVFPDMDWYAVAPLPHRKEAQSA